MKKILGLTVAILLCMSMVATGTWAYSLIDSEASPANSLTAGTLDLVPNTDGTGLTEKCTVIAGGNGINGNVTFENLLPGESGTITWVLVNNGSLSGTLVIASTATFSDVSQNEIENALPSNNGGGNGDLDEYVGVKLQRGVGTDQASAETDANSNYILGSASNFVPLSGLKTILDAQSVAIAASGGNDTIVYKLSWNVATPLTGAGADGLFGTGDDTAVNENIIQSDSAQIDITFTLNQ